MVHPRGTLLGLGLCGWLAALPGAGAAVQAPGAFFPGGMLGVQIGSSWQSSRKSPAFRRLSCQRSGHAPSFDEVCFFKTASRVAGAEIHDGFIARKGDHVVLIGTGITIKNADDPLAETVMRDFESEVHARFQQTGAEVLFVNMPDTPMSADELAGFSQTAPVLLVELESKGHELAVLYGYLDSVNAFSVLTAD